MLLLFLFFFSYHVLMSSQHQIIHLALALCAICFVFTMFWYILNIRWHTRLVQLMCCYYIFTSSVVQTIWLWLLRILVWDTIFNLVLLKLTYKIDWTGLVYDYMTCSKFNTKPHLHDIFSNLSCLCVVVTCRILLIFAALEICS